MFLWILHFLLIFVITLLLLTLFGKCSITAKSVLLTFLAVVFIYLFTCFVHYLIDRKHTALMNQQIQKCYAKEKQASMDLHKKGCMLQLTV